MIRYYENNEVLHIGTIMTLPRKNKTIVQLKIKKRYFFNRPLSM